MKLSYMIITFEKWVFTRKQLIQKHSQTPNVNLIIVTFPRLVKGLTCIKNFGLLNNKILP